MQPTGILETAKAANPLQDLQKYGQSVWLDYIRRNLLTSGELKQLIEEDGLRGMTSNPAIFEKAIVGSTDTRTCSIRSLKETTWMRKRATRFWRFAISRMPPTFCGQCTTAPNGETAM